MLYPAGIVTLVLSDVLGDPLDVIASGPTAPDTSSYGDAVAVLEKYGLMDRAPESAVRHLQAGVLGQVEETPKPGDPVFSTILECRIIGNLAIALEGAQGMAGLEGFAVELLEAGVTGEAGEVGRWLAEQALQAKRRKGRNLPLCLLSGGETTVTVTGKGKGGRNMELALAFALVIRGVEGITLLSAGTDGVDGPTGAAGAYADGGTVDRGLAKGIDAAAALADNDSFTFFREEGGLFVTGPTGTNVNDLQIIVISREL